MYKSQTINESYPRVLPVKLLFAPYAIVFLALITIFIDYILKLDLQNIFPTSAEQLLVLGIIFENPHIVASNVMMLNGEYLQFYKRQLIIGLSLVVGLSVVLITLFGVKAFLTFFYTWTIYHVIRQQIGIGKMVNRQSSRVYTIWSWLFLMISLAIAFSVGYFHTDTLIVPRQTLLLAISILLSLFLVFSLVCLMRLKNRQGRLFLTANVALILTAVLSLFAGFPLFVILLPRIVHDTTAFIIYINHETNRSTPHRKLFLYRAIPSLPIWATLLTFSLLWGAALTYSGTWITVWIAIGLALVHYLTEAFTWRHGSLHRKYLRLAT